MTKRNNEVKVKSTSAGRSPDGDVLRPVEQLHPLMPRGKGGRSQRHIREDEPVLHTGNR